MRDKELIDEMVKHLIAYDPRLVGYEMDGKWLDIPDRVLIHRCKAPIGVEISELLPTTTDPETSISGTSGSDKMQAYKRWVNVLGRTWQLVLQHSLAAELGRISMRFDGPDDIHKKAQDGQLVQEILDMMVTSLPRLKECRQRLGGPYIRLRGQDLAGYPLLTSIVSSVFLWVDDGRPQWHSPCHGLRPPSSWVRPALERASQEKSKKVEQYRHNLLSLPHGKGAKLYLLLWTKNSCPPGFPAFPARRSTGEFVSVFEDSGFDAVWYDSRIPDGLTGEIESAWQLFPAEKDDDANQ